jgi:hypothetical protein
MHLQQAEVLTITTHKVVTHSPQLGHHQLHTNNLHHHHHHKGILLVDTIHTL